MMALAFASCSKPTTSETEDAPSPAAPSTPAATPSAPAGESKATASAPAATPTPARELAPEGVFYLIAAARVETSSSVHGLPPGTGVKRIRPGIYLTPAGELPLAEAQLTNDLAVARAARDAAHAEQSATQQLTAASAASAGQKAKAAASAPPDANHLAALKQIDIEQVTRQIAALEQQKGVLQQQIQGLSNKLSKESFNRVYKGRTTASTTEQQMNTAQTQLQAVQDQISASYQRLNTLR